MRIVQTSLATMVCFAQALAAQDSLVVRADNPAIWGPSPILVEEVRIGVLEGDEDYALASIGGVAAMPNGTIWVSDLQLGAIRRFDADGRFIGQIGRKGEGPGEFMYPGNIRVLPDESIVVWDPGHIRVSLFDTAGVFLDSFNPPTHMIAGGHLEELEIDPVGNLYLVALSRPAQRDLPRRMFWIRMRPDGEVLDSVYMARGNSEGSEDPIRTRTVLSPLGYLVIARNDAYALHRPISDGRILRIERSWDPVPYQRAERAEKERLERGYSERNGKPVRRIPRHKPVYSWFEVDLEGRFWVEIYAPGYVEAETPGEQELRERYEGLLREWRQPFVCEVIESDGRYLGRLRFPNRQTDVMWARGHHVIVVEKGLFDEPYVVRYRIQPGE